MKRESIEPTYEELERGLVFDPLDLTSALVVHAALFYRVASKVALLTAQRDETKLKLAEAEAAAELVLRSQIEAAGAKMPTVGEVAARVTTCTAVVNASQQLLHTNALLARYTALKEAYIQRSYALKEIVSLQINANTPIDVAANEAMARVARESMNQARQEYNKRRDKHDH